ncbi:DUF4296 domain-containing protein [Aquimarina sp. 2-A2]|uniref:DUF4296 domain-containing protein n=1 Tax=Aquimarina sp. 2-A2 TaxID=3382644 RepID=UPI00387EE9BD
MGTTGILNKLLATLFILMIIGCDSVEKVEKPEVLLEEDQMVEILTDIAFIKAAKSSHRSVLNEHNVDPEALIFNKYSIDSAVFAQNNAWYLSKIKVYKDIFTRVKANIDSAKSNYEILKKKEDSIQKITDSIQEIKQRDSLDNRNDKLRGSELDRIQKREKRATSLKKL